MSSKLRIAFQERLEEVNAYLELLTVMDAQAQQGPPRIKGAKDPITPQQLRILYSSVYLQLYNLVEATISDCIKAVAEAVKGNAQCTPKQLNDAMQREWVRVVARTHTTLEPNKRLDSALQLCNHLLAASPIDTFTIEKANAGNWDDREIENVIERVGLELKINKRVYQAIKQPFRNDLGPLAFVKQLRNDLAHGSMSFAECAAEITVKELVELKEKTVDYLDDVVDHFARYIDRFEYLAPEKRPA